VTGNWFVVAVAAARAKVVDVVVVNIVERETAVVVEVEAYFADMRAFLSFFRVRLLWKRRREVELVCLEGSKRMKKRR
jgi:hypothetical protein